MNYSIKSLSKFEENAEIKEEIWKMILVKFLLISVVLVFLFRLAYFQVFSFENYVTSARNNYTNTQNILPNRGIIFDSNGDPLVSNKAINVIAINLQGLNRYKKYKSISHVLTPKDKSVLKKYKVVYETDQVLKDFLKDLSLGKEYFYLKEIESDADYYSILSDLAESDSGNVSVVNTVIRNYRSPEMYSHLLGYTLSASAADLDRDDWYTPDSTIGSAGLEETYESFLRGEKGLLQKIEESTAEVSSEEIVSPAKDGYSLHTSIRPDLQEASYNALSKSLEKNEALGGAVVVQNPNTGEVLALVSLPHFDNNLFSKGISSSDYSKYLDDPSHPMLNRVISLHYPPGSTFKIVTAYAGLVEGSLSINQFINDVGVINVGNFSYKTWKDGGHGTINVIGALKESSDTFFYILGGGHDNYPQIKSLGPWKIYQYARALGFGQKTQLDLPNETEGFVPSPEWKETELNEPWYIGNTYHMAIGQGFLSATPMQTNVLISAVANGGKIYKPYIVKKIVNENTGEIVNITNSTLISEYQMDPVALETIKEGLVEASSPGGTAYPLFNFPITVAGKTGTSEFGDVENLRTHAWYTAFAPVEDPQISITVLVEEGGGGSDVAVPVAKEVLEEFFGIAADK